MTKRKTNPMGKTVQVLCDGCGRDLTTRSNMVDYRLVLSSESKPGRGAGVHTAMMIYSPVDRDYYFCVLPCLDYWRARELHENDLWNTWWANWQQEHGTKDVNGRVRSYPTPPSDLTDPLRGKFKSAAIAAFPISEIDRQAFSAGQAGKG